jgi:hypothetical protein
VFNGSEQHVEGFPCSILKTQNRDMVLCLFSEETQGVNGDMVLCLFNKETGGEWGHGSLSL